ncbi:hypothetical protein BH09PAT1_BH09PAT1_7410 [soil metagenome]
MLILLARFISFIFNPYFLLLPIPYLLVLRQTGDPEYSLKWTLFTLFFLGAVGLSVLVSVRKGYFTDLDISKREQRPLFFFLLIFFAIIYFIALFYFQGPLILFIALSGIFFSIVVFSFINTKIKASLHVASITGLILSFSLLYSGAFFFLLFLIPLIGWSRIKIHRHTRSEVLVGGLMGILIPLVMFLIFKVLLHISFTL